MTLILPLILLVVFVACIGFLYAEGMWSNAVRLINVITAALLAMNFFEPVAKWLAGMMPSYTVLWDYLAIWGLFAIFMAVFRETTDRISRVQVHFLKIVDQVGSPIFAAIIGWVMVCFVLASMHMAPLGKKYMWDGFDPQSNMFFGMFAPDREWFGFTRWVSGGVYNCGNEFDPGGKFIDKQSERREKVADNLTRTGKLRVGE